MINCTYGLCPVWDDGRGSWRRLLIDWGIMPADGGESIPTNGLDYLEVW